MSFTPCGFIRVSVFWGVPPMLSEENQAFNSALCRACGGRCCQGSPGIWIDPQRFFAVFFAGEHLTLEQLRERLPALGLVLYEKSGVPVPAPASELNGCAFLATDGCRFSPAERPCQCLALIPVAETLEQAYGCLCREPREFSREEGRRRWRKYWRTV
jgi:hypothetical protein